MRKAGATMSSRGGAARVTRKGRREASEPVLPDLALALGILRVPTSEKQYNQIRRRTGRGAACEIEAKTELGQQLELETAPVGRRATCIDKAMSMTSSRAA